MRYLLCALLLAAPAEPPQERADWTILVFMAADNDLEGHGVDDLRKMIGAPQSARVRVVVQADRAEEDEATEEARYSGDGIAKLGNFKGAKRLLVEKDDLRELEDLGETNTGDPKVLEDFIAWGAKTFPARRTALVFWNHGYGWQGFGGDESHDDDMLTLPEMGAALKAGLSRAGLARFDLLGFDCCLMGNLDVLGVCRPYARIYVSSEELEPLEGWHWSSILKALADKPDLPADGLARAICASFQEFYEKHPDEDVRGQAAWITLSAVDLDKLPPVLRAFDALGTKLSAVLKGKERKKWLALAKARRAAEEHGADEDPAESGYLIDLHHFARGLAALGAESEAETLRRAIEAAVLHRVQGKDHPESRGISIYFPPEKEVWDAEFEKVSVFKPWLDLVRAYLASGAEDRDPPVLSDLRKDWSVKVAGDDVAETWFVVVHEEAVESMLPVAAGGALKAAFDGRMFAVGDAKESLFMPVGSAEDLGGGRWRCDIPGQYRAPDGKEWRTVTLKFEIAVQGSAVSGKFLGAVMATSVGPSVVKIRPGGTIRPMMLYLDDRNRLVREAVEEGGIRVGPEGLGVVMKKVPAGRAAGFLAVDHSGNAALLTAE